jgi:hypothetical protein
MKKTNIAIAILMIIGFFLITPAVATETELPKVVRIQASLNHPPNPCTMEDHIIRHPPNPCAIQVPMIATIKSRVITPIIDK